MQQYIYSVTATIQSADTSNPPVTIRYYSGPSLVQAMHAQTTAAAMHETVPDPSLPPSVQTRLLAVSLLITKAP